MIEKWLSEQRTTLWGRSWDIKNAATREQAALWFAEQVGLFLLWKEAQSPEGSEEQAVAKAKVLGLSEPALLALLSAAVNSNMDTGYEELNYLATRFVECSVPPETLDQWATRIGLVRSDIDADQRLRGMK